MSGRLISMLKPHPENSRIYGDHADADLVESIKAKGILNPILITFDYRIISGHRRWDAAKRAGLNEVPVVVFGSKDELDILEAVIESNRQRAKTNEQLGREAATLMEIETKRAQRRKHELSGSWSRNEVVENFPPPQSNGKSRDHAGEKLGISGRQAEKAATVVKTIDELKTNGKQREAEQLRTTLNGKSVHSAF